MKTRFVNNFFIFTHIRIQDKTLIFHYLRIQFIRYRIPNMVLLLEVCCLMITSKNENYYYTFTRECRERHIVINAYILRTLTII